MMINKIYVITGQTATGKTDRAIEYAIRLNGEIISADSRQVYKELDIVTGKDREKYSAAGVRAHCVDCVEPGSRFSSHDFVRFAHSAIEDIQSQGKTVIVSGGTYLYIKHLLYGFDVAVPPDTELRKSLESKTLEELQQLIGEYHGMNESDYRNPRRLIRKIEILSSGNKITRGIGVSNNTLFEVAEFIGLRYADNARLEEAIRKRVENRIDAGAVDEVKKLLGKGYSVADPGLTGIGYPQLFNYITGEYLLEQAKQEWITKELQYAKRQYTFMKKDSNISWSIV